MAKNRFSEIKNIVDELEGDFDKFYDKQNQAAGTRVRKAMQDLKNLAQEIRLEVQNIKNSEGAAPAKAGAAKSGTAKAAPKKK